MQGGEIEAKGMSILPCSHQQIANYRKVEKKRDDNVLYSVMLVIQGTQEGLYKMLKLLLILNVFFSLIGKYQTWIDL